VVATAPAAPESFPGCFATSNQRDRRAGEGILLEGLRQAAALGLRHPESGVVHSERLEQAVAQKVAEALARRLFHDAPEHIGGKTVLPGRPGLIGGFLSVALERSRAVLAVLTVRWDNAGHRASRLRPCRRAEDG